MLFSCAYQTEDIGYKHFAIREEGDNTIACYAIDYISNGGLKSTSKMSKVLIDLNQLLTESRCPQKCDQQGCVLLGTGEYAAVYQVTRKKMIVFYDIGFYNMCVRPNVSRSRCNVIGVYWTSTTGSYC